MIKTTKYFICCKCGYKKILKDKEKEPNYCPSCSYNPIYEKKSKNIEKTLENIF